MNFLKLFLRGVALLPSMIQGIEGLFGAGTGVEKKQAALEVISSLINVVDAVSEKKIADATGFTAGLGSIIDGVVACLNASIWAKPAA